MSLDLPNYIEIEETSEYKISTPLAKQCKWYFDGEDSIFPVINDDSIIIKNLSPGFYTLICETEKGETYQIPVHVVKTRENFSNTKVIIQIIKQNSLLHSVEYSSLNTSLIIGKPSRTKEVVNINLKDFTDNTEKISRNHLKLWWSNNSLMLKNIGSHRVYLKHKNSSTKKEIFPKEIIQIYKDDEIYISDLILRFKDE